MVLAEYGDGKYFGKLSGKKMHVKNAITGRTFIMSAELFTYAFGYYREIEDFIEFLEGEEKEFHDQN